MDEPPDPDQQDGASWLGLVAAIVLVAVAVLLLLKLKSGIEMQDCFAQGRHNCDPVDTSNGQ